MSGAEHQAIPDRTTPMRNRIPFLTAALVGLSVAVHLTAMDWIFEFDRFSSHPMPGALTCHLAHYSLSHLAWSLGAFALLGSVCELRGRPRFCLCISTAAIAIPIGLAIFQPSLEHYRGISGIDSALFFLLAVEIVQTEWGRRRGLAGVAILLTLAFVAKILFESMTGSAVFADSTAGAFVPAPLAHLIGAAVGAASAIRLPPPYRVEASL